MKGPSTEDEETMKKIRDLEKIVDHNLDDLLGSDRDKIPDDLNDEELDKLLKNL